MAKTPEATPGIPEVNQEAGPIAAIANLAVDAVVLATTAHYVRHLSRPLRRYVSGYVADRWGNEDAA